jgi:putative FmdB family regulatory protein
MNVPTYQYACTECGNRLEAVQSFSDDPLTECPACQGRLRKLFSSVGVVFKGSGFYRTDSRAGSAISAENGAKPASESNGGKESTKSATDSSSSTSSSSSAKESSSSGGTAKKETAATTS